MVRGFVVFFSADIVGAAVLTTKTLHKKSKTFNIY